MPFIPWIVPTKRLHQGWTPLFPALSDQWVIEYQQRRPKKAVGSPSRRSSKAAWTWSWTPCSVCPFWSRGWSRWTHSVPANISQSVIHHLASAGISIVWLKSRTIIWTQVPTVRALTKHSVGRPRLERVTLTWHTEEGGCITTLWGYFV